MIEKICGGCKKVRQHFARGFCKSCYQYLHQTGKLDQKLVKQVKDSLEDVKKGKIKRVA